MQIDCLLLLVVEHGEYSSGIRPPGLTIVSVVSLLVVGCMCWVLDTPGMLFDRSQLFVGDKSQGDFVGVRMLCGDDSGCL